MSNPDRLNLVILGLSITSSWGNGHATTYRALVRSLAGRGHRVLFLERDKPWYASNRDLPNPPHGHTALYQDLDDLQTNHAEPIRNAHAVIIGSYVPDGVSVAEWVFSHATGLAAFYDIDTPVTLSKLEHGDYEYLHPDHVPRFDLYFSFTGGPTLSRIERRYGSPRALPLYCSVDPDLYYPEPAKPLWDLGYLGTYSDDRQPALERLLIGPARLWPEGRFVVAGPQYPSSIDWPANVERIEHLPPSEHRSFYNRQRFTLNITRAAMVEAGYSPSVRLFEASACSVPVISDEWDGLDTFFEPGREILSAKSPEEVLTYLKSMPDDTRRSIGARARQRVLAGHTASVRARELERGLLSALERHPSPVSRCL